MIERVYRDLSFHPSDEKLEREGLERIWVTLKPDDLASRIAAAVEAERKACEEIARQIHAEVLAEGIDDCLVGVDIADAIAARGKA